MCRALIAVAVRTYGCMDVRSITRARLWIWTFASTHVLRFIHVYAFQLRPRVGIKRNIFYYILLYVSCWIF